MLWTKEEDAILEGLKSMDSSEYKLLLKLKGISSIKKRIIYNSIKLPFVVVWLQDICSFAAEDTEPG